MFATALKKQTSFAQTLTVQNANQIFLVRGLDASGYNAWYYVLVNRTQREAFLGKNGTPQLKLSDYGAILYSGFGDEPPEHIRQRMQDEYNFTTS